MIGNPQGCSRLALAWQHRGCSTFQEWSARFPEDVQFLRKGVLTLAAAVERRQVQYLRKNFSALTVCDMRMGVAAREKVALDLLRKNRCCLPEGIQRSLVLRARQGLNGEQLPDQCVQNFLRLSPVCSSQDGSCA